MERDRLPPSYSQLNLRVSVELREQLERQARREERTLSNLIRRLLRAGTNHPTQQQDT